MKDFTSEPWRPRIVQLMGLSWSGCTELDHEQDGDDRGQQDDQVPQQAPSQIPGSEREDAADIVARAAMPRVDQTFPLSVGR